VAASPQVSDPFGQSFVGKVDEYIKRLAESETGVGSSPTRFVSAKFLTQSLKDLAANGEKGLTRKNTAHRWLYCFHRLEADLATPQPELPRAGLHQSAATGRPGEGYARSAAGRLRYDASAGPQPRPHYDPQPGRHHNRGYFPYLHKAISKPPCSTGSAA